ncbi:MAG: hypothetical protein ACLP4R_27295 [Solirubrobacteraceae bacterium]
MSTTWHATEPAHTLASTHQRQPHDRFGELATLSLPDTTGGVRLAGGDIDRQQLDGAATVALLLLDAYGGHGGLVTARQQDQ